MFPFSKVTSSQIRYLLNTSNESNSDSLFQQLCQQSFARFFDDGVVLLCALLLCLGFDRSEMKLEECVKYGRKFKMPVYSIIVRVLSSENIMYIGYGIEGSILVLQTCLDNLNIYENDLKNMKLAPVIASVFKHILEKPNFSTIICESLRTAAVNETLLENLCNALRLSSSEKIGFGLALSDSENLDIRMCGKNFCMAQIEDLCANNLTLDSAEQIQNILIFLNRFEGLSKLVDSFMQMLSLVQLREDFAFILSPLLLSELREANFLRNLDLVDNGNEFDDILAEMEKETSMSDIMKELGYGCTVNVTQCREMLSLFLPLTEVTVAKIIGTIVRTDAGLEDSSNTFLTFCSAVGSSSLSDLPLLNSWNIDVLVDSINQLAPGINWIKVFANIDHEGFYIPNEAAFSVFMSIYKQACQDPFPISVICGSVWKNAEGQLSFLKNAVTVPPEVFSFAHSGRQLGYTDALNDLKFQSGHANHAWLCLDLLEVLCQLAERGHATVVRSMLEYPLKHCPEVLILGIAQINSAYNLLQYEVSYVVLPMVFKSAAANSIALHLWNVNPSILMRGFVDALTVDQDHITRVFDLCQELKILSPVLDIIPCSFGIKLAALASRKDLVDLETWLSSNLSTYKDIFFEECINFVKSVKLASRFHQSGAQWSVYSETISTFLKVLQAHAGLISSSQLSEEIEKLNGTFMHASSRTKNGAGTADSSTSDGYAEDVEAEANSYFHQMFSGQLTIDSMVQTLARFRESTEKREQSIFDCMIANLFEEYKFFSKYPERQLKIAAVLFGSLIKHQLVTHLTLGIALRAVLDALRKPADSKMFVFGTLSVEQFVDRLIEWPQYCNHILQISHLRSTHLELVTFIERALARISSGHPESETGHSSATDQQQDSVPATQVEMPVSSFPLIGSSSAQQGLQLSSAAQLQQRHQITLEERQKASVTISNYMKPVLSPAAQPSVVPPTDAVTTQKACTPQSAVVASPALASSTGFVRSSRATSSARFGSALNIETLVAAAERRETPIEAPASEIQDKISFIINNLSTANLEAKAKEIAEFLKEQYYPWFAQYMVMKRASIEPNFHDLYLKFLDKVNLKPLNKEIIQATYENCKVLLGSELIKSSSEERSLLKNLGSWLGKLTIGRNQVLRAREIDPKSLIIEAYEKGLMIAVIPFTSKILEPCQSSLAYKPPNPWTVGILGLLVEIYAMPNLKMNLKFDIEMVSEVKSGGIVSTINQVDLPLDVATPSLPSSHSRILAQYAAPLHISSGTLMEDEKLAALGLSDQLPSAQGLLQGQSPFPVTQVWISELATRVAPFLHVTKPRFYGDNPREEERVVSGRQRGRESCISLSAPSSNIEQQVVVNSKLHALGLQLHFQSVLPIAMDRAIKEIVSSIVQRSVSIATQTTKELVLKDYAMESDESRIRSAAHLMVASLAGSLAHVTCKEPLRGSISSQLRNSLQGLSIASELLEHAVQLVTNDNLDLGCALIEQAATEKALQTIDGEIAQQLSIRRKHREGVGSTFFDASLYTQGHMGVLPEALRPKPGRLSHSQQRVYEDFVRLPWQNQSGQNSNAGPVGPAASSGSGILSRGYGSASGQLNPSMYSSGVGSTGIGAVAQSLDFVPEETESNLAKLHSASSVHIGMAEDTGPHNFENSTVISSFSSAPAPELHSVEPSNVKDFGAASSPIPSPSASERLASNISEPILTTGDALDMYQIISEKLETLVASDAKEGEIQAIIAEVPAIILRCISRDEATLAVAQKVFKGLYENASNGAHVGAHLAILAAIRDVSKLVVKELTSWVIYSDEDRKFNKDVTIGLIRNELLNLAEYNVHMAKLLDAGRNKAATEFAISLIQTLVISDSSVISELHNLVDALAKLAARPGSPESLQQLVEIARNPAAVSLSGLTIGKDDNTRQSRERKATGNSTVSREDYNVPESVEPDPAGFREQVSMLFAEWYRICELPGANDAACAHFVLQLLQSGLLKGDAISDRFFRCLMFSPVDQGSNKFSLLSKVLSVTVKYVLKDAEETKASFNPRPYFRLFINWLLDLSSLEPVIDGANFQVLTTLANTFHALQPLKVPAFSFCDVIPPSCIQMRNIILSAFPRNMRLPDPSTPNLKIDLLAEISQSPRILSEVDAVLKAKQMKNDVDEYLKTRQQGSSFLSELKQKLLLPPSEAARAGTRYSVPLINSLVLYVGMQAIQQLQARTPPHAQSMASSVPLAVFLVGAALDIFQTLIVDLDTEGRYLFLNAIANQLRYPNNHTHYFSFILLYLFAESNQLKFACDVEHELTCNFANFVCNGEQEVIQEQITRVLLERLIVNRPHPWGLLITFIELIKNPRYNFWSRSFTRCAPEIEKLFESVSRSCGGPKPVEEGGVVTGGGLSDMH
ncbi:hypothetical protein LguiA_010257 [Lonicera macranthoides]